METDESHKNKYNRIETRKDTKIKMLKVITSFMLTLNVASQLASAAMSLPDGIENILGFVPKSTFQCEKDGYFGDIDNDCRIFHLCQKHINPDGRKEWRHWTYACGNQTMFNQLTLTCAFVDEAIPCKHASQFQYLNEVIHKPKEPFLTDADVTSGISYYSNRIMSDGARARAFEDSRLLAQLGGGQAMFKSISNNDDNNELLQFHHQGLKPQVSVDAEDSSNSALNSIGMKELPLTESFQTLNQKQQQQNLQASLINQRAADIIISHQHHFQHTSQPVSRSPQFGLTQFSSLHAASNNNNNQQQQQRRQFNNPTTLVQPSTPTTDLNSFDFSISTNHQVGPVSPGSDSSIVISNQFTSQAPLNQQQRQQQQQPVTFPIAHVTTPVTAEQFQPSLATTASVAAAQVPNFTPTFVTPSDHLIQTTTPQARQQPTTTITTAPLTSRPINQAPVTETQLASTQRSQSPPPPTTTTTTSVTTTAIVPVEGRFLPQLRRRQVELGNGQSSRNQQQARQPKRNQNTQILLDQIHNPSFQFTRLSSQSNRQQEMGRARRSDTSVVIHRKSVPAIGSSAAAPAPNQQAALTLSVSRFGTDAPRVVQDAGFLESPNSFWQRSFDAQLMAPKFESLLTRRRV